MLIAAILGDVVLIAWAVAKFVNAMTKRASSVTFEVPAPASVDITVKKSDALALWVERIDSVTFIVLPLLLAAVSYTIFLFWRQKRVIAWYIKKARQSPANQVPTAGKVIGEVIGRDELCDAIIGNVCGGGSPTPNVIVGTVGAGKTALLVELTKRLAEHKYVPVAVRLGDSQSGLDFCDLGQKRFAELINERAFGPSDAERIWRNLRRDQRVVVLADGLEEALRDEAKVEDRESLIQAAVRRAIGSHLPLVITSRHHDPLRALNAPIIELEPLGEAAALDFLTLSATDSERRVLSRLVQVAEAAESPMYLHMIHELDQQNKWRALAPGEEWSTQVGQTLNDVGAQKVAMDRIGLRLRVLNDWKECLLDGHFMQDYALDRTLRERTVIVLSALACVGLARARLDVKFDDLVSLEDDGNRRYAPQVVGDAVATQLRRDLEELDKKESEKRLAKLHPRGVCAAGDSAQSTDSMLTRVNLRDECILAATFGSELGIVQARGEAVRFQHSIIQSFLGTRYLAAVLSDRRYSTEAFWTLRPGFSCRTGFVRTE